MVNLRAAVIGIGFVGRAHLEALRRLGVPVAGILGSSPDRTKDSANSLRLDRAYSSLEELAGDKEVDVVHICTPNHLHHDQANTLLKAGKHVMCAKHLATVIPVRRKPRGRVETFQKRSVDAFDEVKINTDDYGSVLLHFENSLRGVMTVSQVSAGRKARLWFEVDGSEGSLAWHSESPNVLWIGHRNEANQRMMKDPALMSPEARGYAAYPGGHIEGYPDTFVQLFNDFYGYISAGDFQAPRRFPTFETGHEELVLCDAIAASARERRWVKV